MSVLLCRINKLWLHFTYQVTHLSRGRRLSDLDFVFTMERSLFNCHFLGECNLRSQVVLLFLHAACASASACSIHSLYNERCTCNIKKAICNSICNLSCRLSFLCPHRTTRRIKIIVIFILRRSNGARTVVYTGLSN